MSHQLKWNLTRISLLAAILTLCGLAWAGLAKPESEPPRAELKVYEALHDLGAIPVGFVQQVPFRISNHGSRRLVVNELDSECNCSNRVVRTIILAPGQTQEIDVPFDARSAAGLVETTTRFTTSDPTQPHFALTVRGRVVLDDDTSSE